MVLELLSYIFLFVKSMTSGRKHISQDNSCTKQCQFLQRRDMHFNPETFNVAMQILIIIVIIIIIIIIIITSDNGKNKL